MTVRLTVGIFFLSIITLLCGRLINRNHMARVWGLYVIVSSVLSIRICGRGRKAGYADLQIFDFGTGIGIGFIDIRWALRADLLTVVRITVVIVISGLVQLYALYYMGNDPHLIRFIAYIGLFAAFILLMVGAANGRIFLVGWEGIGMCSFLLIGFGSTRATAVKAALKAIIMNKIGDRGLRLRLILCISVYGSVDFEVLNCCGREEEGSTMIFGALLLAVIAKSAQVGLHTGLTDAREGPTPVSALLHAATMVTAGVFLVRRLQGFFSSLPFLSTVVLGFVGARTVVVCGGLAIKESDIKKVIALSTANHLGFILILCGLGCYAGSLFHLVNHAVRKALLFMAAGRLIHMNQDRQSVRFLIPLKYKYPAVFMGVLISVFSLLGGVFMSGFYSKELVFVLSVCEVHVPAIFFSSLICLRSLFVSSVYSVRIVEAFAGVPNLKLMNIPFVKVVRSYQKGDHVVENNLEKIRIIVIVRLAILALFSGVFFYSIFFSGNMGMIEMGTSIYTYEILPIFIKVRPVIGILIGVVGVNFYSATDRLGGNFGLLAEFRNNSLVISICRFFKHVRLVVEKGAYEGILFGIVKHFRFGGIGQIIRRLYTGKIYNLLCVFILLRMFVMAGIWFLEARQC